VSTFCAFGDLGRDVGFSFKGFGVVGGACVLSLAV